VSSLTLSAPTAQDWGRVRPSRRASVVRQPPWDPTEKGLHVDYLHRWIDCSPPRMHGGVVEEWQHPLSRGEFVGPAYLTTHAAPLKGTPIA
jgi:hypothetical protein